jgi:hypothetical protein
LPWSSRAYAQLALSLFAARTNFLCSPRRVELPRRRITCLLSAPSKFPRRALWRWLPIPPLNSQTHQRSSSPLLRVSSSSVVRANFPYSLTLGIMPCCFSVHVILFAVAAAVESLESLNSPIASWLVIDFIFVMVLTSAVPIRTCQLMD